MENRRRLSQRARAQAGVARVCHACLKTFRGAVAGDLVESVARRAPDDHIPLIAIGRIAPGRRVVRVRETGRRMTAATLAGAAAG
jgi:hypothetical protein